MFRTQTRATVAVVLSFVFGFLCAESFACDACDKAKKSGDAPACCSPSGENILNPAHTKVKVKLGGYRLSVNYAGGEGGSIAREADEAEVIGPDINVGVGLARDLRQARDAQASQDVCKLFKAPFTRVVTQVVQMPCPQPVLDDCRGLAFRRPIDCRGFGVDPIGPLPVAVGPYVRPVVAGPIVGPAYGRCAAWGLVRGAPLSCYANPPHGREFWCDCVAHRQAVVRVYGPAAVWQLVPCMCPEGCGRCGGAGRCGH